MAMVKAISEQSPQYGGYVHFGATSQDVNDTVTALQMQECKVRVTKRSLPSVLRSYANSPAVGHAA